MAVIGHWQAVVKGKISFSSCPLSIFNLKNHISYNYQVCHPQTLVNDSPAFTSGMATPDLDKFSDIEVEDLYQDTQDKLHCLSKMQLKIMGHS